MTLFPVYAAAAAAGAHTAEMNLSETALVAIIGWLIVFGGLTAILALVKLQDVLILGFGKRGRQAAAAALSAPRGVPAAGSLGELKLQSVDDKTAAMLMAIVADEMKAPLNELRFISIREE